MPSWNTYHLTWVSLTLGRGVSLYGCSSKAQLLLLTLHEGYATFPDLKCEISPLGPPAPTQPWLLGHGVGPPGHRPWPRSCSCSSPPPPLASGLGAWGISSQPQPLTSDAGYLPLAAPPDLGRGVAPLGRCPSGMGSSQLLPLTSDMGWLLSAALWHTMAQPPALWRTRRMRIAAGVRQGCILSPCLFNLYAEYIMRNAGLEETQTGIKIVGRNINNLRYADEPPLWQKVKRNSKAS